jgi:hypothetical protein
MTLDELNTVFDFAVSRSIQTNREDVSLWSCRGAGIRAVAEAIMNQMKYNPTRCWACSDNDELWNEILASDGVKSEGSE